eukprot:scaffold535_cov42-Cyclotella_meneghiniana.AAC.5
MIAQAPRCNGKGCNNRRKWNCLDNDNTTKFEIDRKAVAAVTLPVDKIPEPNKEKYTGVRWRDGKYEARVRILGTDHVRFTEIIDAATMYAKAKILYKDFDGTKKA